MGRRTSGQQVGLEKIGNVQANGSTLTTTQTNSSMTLAPNGTGTVTISPATTLSSTLSVASDVTILNQGDLRLSEATANGSNYLAMQAASTMASNYTITWPNAVAGSNGYVLSSDTSGNLSWVSSGGTIAVSDPGSSATVHYPLFGTSAGSLPTTLVPYARTNLSFVPSTGELTATIVTAPTHNGSSTSGGTLTIRGTSNGTKATASVLMTDNVSSSSTTTGTLVVTGGVGISGNMYAGGNAIVTGNVTANGSQVASVNTYTYSNSGDAYNSAGYMTGYTHNGIAYSLIVYEDVVGQATSLGGQYKRVTTWRETDSVTGSVKNYTASYSSTTGRLTAITVA